MASSSESFTESSDSEVEVGLFHEKGRRISVRKKKKKLNVSANFL